MQTALEVFGLQLTYKELKRKLLELEEEAKKSLQLTYKELKQFHLLSPYNIAKQFVANL